MFVRSLKIPALKSGLHPGLIRRRYLIGRCSIGGTALNILVQELEREIPAEGYQLEVESSRIAIYCSDTAGLYNAFKTLRMAAESERGVMTSSKWQLPCMII